MEKKNSVFGVLVILLSIVFLGLTAFIVYDKVLNKDTNDDSQGTITIDDSDINSALLNSLYKTLGINVEDSYYGDCLNYFLSNNNYKENAQKIFDLYVAQNRLSTNHYNDGSCNEECHRALSCAECGSVKKVNADRTIKLYSLDNLKLDELPGFKDEYAYISGIPMGVCHYKVAHDTSSEYIDSDSIRITDKQVVDDYEFGSEKINSTTNQTAIYDMKKDSNGDYYLSQVTVK